MFYVSMFFQYIGQYAKTRFQYRADLVVEIFSDLLFQAVNLVFILVVFGHTQLLGGWSREEIIFIYGFFLVPYALFSAFFNIWDFNERYIVKGEMDRILTRPIHSLFQVILERMELESLFGAITGIAVMVYAGSILGLDFAWYDIFIFLLFVIGGALVYAGIFVMLASIGFWSDARTSIMPMMYNVDITVCFCRGISFCLFSRKNRVVFLCLFNPWSRNSLFHHLGIDLEQRSNKI